MHSRRLSNRWIEPVPRRTGRRSWSLAVLLCSLVLAGQNLGAAPHRIDDYHWDQVQRIVAIGDLHGDYTNYLKALQGAGVVDARGKWIGGETHLVQLGDIPDRGANTLKIIAHLQKLAEQARRKGGRVHTLLGNHEAMNTYGDLRYVSEGEFAAFAERDASAWRDAYYQKVLEDMKSREPERYATLPDDFREAWNASHPLGWVEHQRGWNPKWNAQARYYQWALHDKVAIQLNDLIFVHGGISGTWCRNSLASLTAKALAALRQSDPASPSILTDANGPLWYRGLAGVAPTAAPETVTAILAGHNAHYIVIGHTPTHGAIWPRYSGRVIQVDTGMSAAYGGHVAWLEVTTDGLTAGYPGGKVRLPVENAGRIDYLRKVVALQPDNAGLAKQLSALEEGVSAGDDTADADADSAHGEAHSAASSSATALPICGISP
jgi:hypothetical protein